MTVQTGRSPSNMWDLLQAARPTGEQMIRVLGCRADVPNVFKAKAEHFAEVLAKADVSRSELKEMGKWAALGLTHCAEHRMPLHAKEFEQILDLCKRQLGRQESVPAVANISDLKGWRF